jgi:hypothetical protein
MAKLISQSLGFGKKPSYKAWYDSDSFTPGSFLIERIWFPGQYSNYTFETTEFRLSKRCTPELVQLHEALMALNGLKQIVIAQIIVDEDGRGIIDIESEVAPELENARQVLSDDYALLFEPITAKDLQRLRPQQLKPSKSTTKNAPGTV